MTKFYTAPVGTSLQDMVRLMGVEEDQVDEFVRAWSSATAALTASPKEELLFRLNAQLRGDDPGQPVNWRGL